jgi:integrase/recombinase XerD
VAGLREVSALRAAAGEYLATPRALGFLLETQRLHLMSFVRVCEERGADRVTADLAIERATRATRGSGHELYQARRLDVVRIFARHLQPLDPATGTRPMTCWHAATCAFSPTCTPRPRS